MKRLLLLAVLVLAAWFAYSEIAGSGDATTFSERVVIPKGAYVTFDHFAGEASAEELTDFHRTAAKVCAMLDISPGHGYRAITNAGAHGMQEVPHYHLHILAGRLLGRMIENS